MAGPIQVLLSPNSGGGLITAGPGLGARVFAGGLPVMTVMSTVTPHAQCFSNPPQVQHCITFTTGLGGTTGRVFVGGLPVSVTGDPDTCGHTRLGGVPTVIVG